MTCVMLNESLCMFINMTCVVWNERPWYACYYGLCYAYYYGLCYVE